MTDKPSLYLDSKLFHRPVRDVRGKEKSMTIPDPQLAPIEPDEDESITKKATELLQEMTSMLKAGAAQESGEGWTSISQQRRKRGYDRSFLRDSRGVSGGATPDLPERGKDWHGTVPGVPDEPQGTDQEELDRPPANLVDSDPDAEAAKKNDEAKKALAAAPRFSPGPFVPPREREFLQMRGWSNEDIESGQASMSPRLRAEFNKWLTGTVQKSISSFAKSLG